MSRSGRPMFVNVDDARRLAKRRLPRMIFDYVDGGARSELTKDANRAAFEEVTFRPRMAVHVPAPATETTVFGVPVSILGAGYFAALLALLTLGRRLDALASYLLVSALVGLGFVLYLAWATIFVLGTLCLLCLATYAAVVGLFFIAGAAASTPMIDVPDRLTNDQVLAPIDSRRDAVQAQHEIAGQFGGHYPFHVSGRLSLL